MPLKPFQGLQIPSNPWINALKLQWPLFDAEHKALTLDAGAALLSAHSPLALCSPPLAANCKALEC